MDSGAGVSSEFCKIYHLNLLKNTFFTEPFRVAASASHPMFSNVRYELNWYHSFFIFLIEYEKKRFCKKRILKNFANFIGKHLCWSLFWIKLQLLLPATLLKRDSNTCFPEKFSKFIRVPFLKNSCERLLVDMKYILN